MRLVLGTTNPAKQTMLRGMLAGLAVDPLSPSDLGAEPPIQEGVVSARANAEAKARAWRDHYRLPALATDGGLVVPALETRWNPILTRRAAGAHASPAQHAAHLLQLMHDLRGDERLAWRVEAIALAISRGDAVRSWQATGSPALVADWYDPRGVPGGFWLPGVLLFGPRRARYADLSGPERDAVDDHWAKLAEPVRAAVATLLWESNG